MAMVCTPIFINTFVVFIRLYWFERKFQNVVREARRFRRTKSRSKTEPRDKLDPSLAEKGVRGRSIVVLHNGEANMGDSRGSTAAGKVNAIKDTSDGSRTSSSTSQKNGIEATDHALGLPTPQQQLTFRREITFADDVKSGDGEDSTPAILPQRLSPEEHIKFLENQRNPKDKGALRIPGPRDFDRGSVPEPLNIDDDGAPLSKDVTTPMGLSNEDPVKRNITIDEPEHSRLRDHILPKLLTPKTATSEKSKAAPTDEDHPQGNRVRARTGTFSSLRNWGTKENEPPATPYLSWQPTIGRNSAFVDLTEEQREELGGIEYRSLKTLAVVLVCKFGDSCH